MESEMPPTHDQRQYGRFGLQGSAYAVFRPEFTKIGRINDISGGGLGCNYLCPVDQETIGSRSDQVIDIIISNNSFYLAKIPCNLVYDTKAIDGQEWFMPDFVNRRCGLKFDQLTREQEKEINHFLGNVTVPSESHA